MKAVIQQLRGQYHYGQQQAPQNGQRNVFTDNQNIHDSTINASMRNRFIQLSKDSIPVVDMPYGRDIQPVQMVI
jgi:hypothetical protein